MIAGDLAGERARLTPDRTALVYVPTGERLTYREFDGRVSRCARVLTRRLGLRRGDRVGVLAHNGLEFLELFFAAGKTGVIVVPLGTRLVPAELVPIARDAGLSALFYERELAAAAEELLAALAIPHALVIGEDYPGVDADDLDPFPADPALHPEHPWCLLYTSGTTGTPKGVILPHRMILWNGYNTAAGWQLRDDDISPIFTPLYHAGGLSVFLVPLFVAGGTLVLHRGFDVAEVLRALERERCTVVFGVPTIFQRLMEAKEFGTADLSRVRWLISGGAPLPRFVSEAYQRRGLVFKQGYGLTEVGVNCFAMTVEDSFRKPGSIGKPLPFTRARIVLPEGAEAGADEVGELWLKGPHVCAGYWNDPAATAAALDAEGWFHTGDLARRDAEGYVTIAGRRKDMIISGGVNVYPAEIEGLLLQHPGVQDAAVVGVPDERWGEAGVAFVVPVAGAAPDEAALRAFLEARLARYKLPRAFVFRDELPRTPYGKVVKPELRAHYLRDA